jgi:hypothetical protein
MGFRAVVHTTYGQLLKRLEEVNLMFMDPFIII